MKTIKITFRSSALLALCLLICSNLAAATTDPPPPDSQSSVDSTMRARAMANGSGKRIEASDTTRKNARTGTDTLRQLRYGQKALRTGDPTLFATSGGSVGPDYQLGPGDELIISVWGQKQARYQPVIDRDGQVYLDGVGMISLNGTTFQDAKGIIGRKLSGIYSGISAGFSHFDLTLGKLKQIRIFVVGDVERPGGYVFSGASTALQAVAVAGGPTDLGSDRLALISRGGTNIEIDLYQYLFLGKRAAKDNLQDGDVIRVPVPRASALISGEVHRPGIYEIRSDESTANLIEFAGGLTSRAANAPMTLSRIYENGRRDAGALGSPQDAISGRRKDPLRNGDEIVVQAGTARSNASLFISGAIRYPGIYPYLAGATLRSLVTTAGGTTERALLSRALILRQDSTGSRSTLRASLDREDQTPLYPMDSVILADRISLDSTAETVTITGAVRNPGTFRWQAGLRLKDLVVLAGGFLPQADIRAARIDHKDPKGLAVESRTLDLDSSLSTISRDAAIQSQSLVSIPSIPGWSPLRTIVLQGHFSHPETYSLAGTPERLSSLSTRAGGPLPAAYLAGATLLRKGVGRLQINLPRAIKRPGSEEDMILEDGDTLMLPSTPATVLVSGRVRKPGHIVWRDGKDWKWYVDMAGGTTDSAYEEGVFIEYADGSIRTDRQGLVDPNPGSVVTIPFRVPPQKVSLMETLTAVSILTGVISTAVTTWLLLQR